MKRFLLPSLIAALATPAHALIDTDTDGLGDIWENIHGFHIGPNPPANQAPTSDPDGDGFTNLKESTAGTDPLDREDFPKLAFAQTPAVYEPLPPDAEPPPSPPPPTDPFDPNYIPPPPAPDIPRILLDPPVSILTWPTVPGKTYEAFPSEDLSDWTTTTGAFLGAGIPHTFESESLYPDGTVPTKLFWRVGIADTDSDGDGLTDYEELHTTDPNDPGRALDPFNPDTDGDGIPDNLDAAPFVNSLQFAWDEDSLEPAGAALFASYNFTPAAGSPGRIPDISGHTRHATARYLVGSGFPLPLGALPPNAEGIAGDGFRNADTRHLAFETKNPGINFQPVATLSFWLKTKASDLAGAGQPLFSYVPKDAVFNAPGNTANPYTVRAYLRKQSTGEAYEIVWYDWRNPGGLIRERWDLDMAANQLDGNWVNLTFVWQGGSGSQQTSYWACYANGIMQNRTQNSVLRFQTSAATANTPQDTFLIGADASGGNPANNQATVAATFKGALDRVRLYTAALTSAQVMAIVSQDADNDELHDSTEASATTWKDTNGNGIREAGEIFFPNTNPIRWQPADTDTDRDGLTDLYEQNITRTLLHNHDTDGDLLPDGWEHENNLNPLSAAGINGTTGNADNDGLDNFDEWRFLSDPHLADTDGDGVNDGPETAQGSDPNDPADNGQAPPAGEKLTLKILVGDPSTSHSERWRIEAEDIATGQTVLRHASRQYGQMSTAAESTFDHFKPGKAYRFKLRHAGTDPEKLALDPERLTYPDYDWSLQISYKNAQGNFIDLADPAQSKYLVLEPYNAGSNSISQDTPKLLAPLDPWGTIGEGQEAKYDYEEKILPMQVVMLPVETLTGVPGSDNEAPGNWLIAEGYPRPAVDISVSSAELIGADLQVTVQGTVTDPLSKYAHYPVERLRDLIFKHQDQVLHTITLPAAVGDGHEFEETFIIPDVEPIGYVIRAETSENHAGFSAYDEVSVSLGWQDNAAAFPAPGGPMSIHFPQAPTPQTTDQAIVYLGGGNPPSGHGQTSETAADSSVFVGSYLIPTANGNLTANCRFEFSSPPDFSTVDIDSVVIGLASDIQGHPSNHLYSRWIETAPNSRIFREQTQWSFNNQTLTVLGTENLHGTPPSVIEPCTVRLPALPDGGSDPGKIRIVAGDRKYRLIRVGDHWYPEDPAQRGTPKLFLPSASGMPSRLKAHGYDPQTGYFDLSLKLNATTTFGQAARFHVVPGREEPSSPLPAPLALRANPPSHWKPGDPVDKATVLAAYRFLHADSSYAIELLEGYLRGGHLIETKDLLFGYLDLDVDLGPILTDLNDNIWTIQIEEDVNPIRAANLLFEGLKHAYLEIEVHRNHEFNDVDDAEAFKVAMQQAVLATQKTTIAATELYLSGLGVINEGLDWIIIVNDVADGHPESLAAALPFVSAGLVKSGGNLVIKNASGEVLDTLDSAAFRELRELGLEGNLEAAGTVFDEYGYSLFLRKTLTSNSAPVRVPGDKEHGKLRKAMENIGAPPGKDYAAHHDFPWAERKWFAERGIDVNDPGYGRWIKKDKHGGWHGWRGGQFNAWWRAVQEAESGLANGRKYTRLELMQKLVDCRQVFPSTP